MLAGSPVLFRADGIGVSRLGPLPPTLMPALLELPDAVFRQVARAALRADARACSTMWEDPQRGRPTEVDSFRVEVTALAARRGLAAPANEALTALVHETQAAESADRRTWSGPEPLAPLDGRRLNGQ
ncbi:ketopantoate reductase C-terminal domain-containing protein [Streptomyces sp. NPDC006487]|uniref:ketopantoate reductase C-terminal domain-containing protein n=1 Tax=Streptomyces sp. NPDC006487 TaxID=3364748 RepID=UPI0036B48EC5